MYERDGAVCVRRAFAPDWLALLERGVEANLAQPGPAARRYTPQGSPGMFFGDYCNWQRIPEYRAFLAASPAAAIAGTLMRSRKVNLFHEHVLVKEPGTREATPWHHDQPYWTVDGADVCSVWIPLDAVARGDGVRFVAGSHVRRTWFRPKRFIDGADYDTPEFAASVPDIDAHPEMYPLLSWDLVPGDCIVFAGLTLHGAAGNASARRRRAFSARFTGDDAVFALRRGVMSPPPPSDAPPPGEPMDCASFPVVWRAGA